MKVCAVIVEPNSLNSQSQPRGLLEQFEMQWLRGEIPQIAFYLSPVSALDTQLWPDLIELDLEYRWKRFHSSVTTAERDEYGFPQFPRLEDYAALLEESQRHLVLTPELLAEEYRVRRTWGGPARQAGLPGAPAARFLRRGIRPQSDRY